MGDMSIYIRVKRKKTTVFVHVEPTDTVLEVKQKLQQLIDQPADQQRLFKDSVVLDESKRLVDLKVENDDVVALAYLQEDGTWEAVDIASPEMGGDQNAA